MSEKKISFVKHALIYGLGAVSLQLAGIILMPIYTHCLDPSEYGLLQFIYRVGTLFHICLLVEGIQRATFNLVEKTHSQRAKEQTAASITAVILLMLVVGVILILALGQPLGALLGVGDKRLFICGLLVMMLQSTTVMPLAMMQARYESIAFVAVTAAIALSHVTLAIITVAVLGWGVWGVIGGLAIAHGGFGLALTLRELVRGSFRPDPKQVKAFLQFSLPLVPVGLAGVAMFQGDMIVLMKFHGAAAVGVYALAQRIVHAIHMFSTEPFHRVWEPWIYKAHKQPDGPVLIGKAATRIVAVYVLCAVGAVLLRHEGIWILSSAYAEAATIIPILALASLFMLGTHLVDASYYVTSLTGRRNIAAAAATVVFLVGFWLLIPQYRAVGAACVALIGFLFHLLVNLVIAQRTYYVRYEWGRLTALVTLAGVIVLVGWRLDPGLLNTATKSLLWASFPAALWISGLITPEEQRYVRENLSRAYKMVWQRSATIPERPDVRAVDLTK